MLAATAIALTGTLLPILITMAGHTHAWHKLLLINVALLSLAGAAVFAPNPEFGFKESVVVGTSLSSTAIGM